MTEAERVARENGWTEVAEDPRGYEPGVPCLWHEDLERSWPAGDWMGACEDIDVLDELTEAAQ